MELDIFKLAEDNVDKYKAMLHKINNTYGDDNFIYNTSHREMTNIEHFLIFLYIIQLKPEVIFETGFFKGRTSLIMLEALREYNIDCKYYVANINKKANIYFKEDYENFTVLSGGGELVIKDVPENGIKAISIVDSPKFKNVKKSYSVYDQLLTKFNMLAMFQHDIGHEPDKTHYRRYFKDRKLKYKFKRMVINSDFINKYKNIDEGTTKEILGLFVKN